MKNYIDQNYGCAEKTNSIPFLLDWYPKVISPTLRF